MSQLIWSVIYIPLHGGVLSSWVRPPPPHSQNEMQVLLDHQRAREQQQQAHVHAMEQKQHEHDMATTLLRLQTEMEVSPGSMCVSFPRSLFTYRLLGQVAKLQHALQLEHARQEHEAAAAARQQAESDRRRSEEAARDAAVRATEHPVSARVPVVGVPMHLRSPKHTAAGLASVAYVGMQQSVV